MKLSNEQLEKLSQSRRVSTGGLREEVAGLSQGNPLIFDSYLSKTRYEMWIIALGA